MDTKKTSATIRLDYVLKILAFILGSVVNITIGREPTWSHKEEENFHFDLL